jgi:hypothetical protein
VKVFCWTLTHCCSSGAMVCLHQSCRIDGAHAAMNMGVVTECLLAIACSVFGWHNNEWHCGRADSAVIATLATVAGPPGSTGQAPHATIRREDRAGKSTSSMRLHHGCRSVWECRLIALPRAGHRGCSRFNILPAPAQRPQRCTRQTFILRSTRTSIGRHCMGESWCEMAVCKCGRDGCAVGISWADTACI